jgi:hypothetical protein
LFSTFGFLAPKDYNYLAFQSFDFERLLMKVIPETCVVDIYILLTIYIWISSHVSHETQYNMSFAERVSFSKQAS